MSTDKEPFIIMKEIKMLKCLHCGNEWKPRFERLPSVCPACRSSNWMKPRIRKAHHKIRKTQSI